MCAGDARYEQIAPFVEDVPLESPLRFRVGPGRGVHEGMSFEIVLQHNGEGVSARCWGEPAKPFFDRRVYPLAHALECRSRLAARLRWLDPTCIANRQPAEPPTKTIMKGPGFVAAFSDAEREAAEGRVKIFHAPVRRWLHSLDEQVREFLCRHDSCSFGVSPGQRYPVHCPEIFRTFQVRTAR